MAKFPIIRKDLTVSGRSTSVRQNINTDTGAGAIGQAMAGLGGVMMDLGKKYDLMEANTQFSKYKSEVGKLEVQRDAEVLNASNSDEIKAIYEKYESQKQDFMPKNHRAAQAVSLFENQQAPKTAQSLFNARRKKIIDNERARIFEMQQEVFDDPSKLADFDAEFSRIQKLDKNNPDDVGPVFKESEAAKILFDTKIGAEKQTIYGLFDKVLENPTSENITVAKNTINNSSMDNDDKFRMGITLRSMISGGEAKKTEQYKAYKEQQSSSIGELISKGEALKLDQPLLPEVQPLADTLIERQANSDLNNGDKITFDSIRNNILSGKHYNQNTLLEAYATGLSTEEYTTLVTENKENEKLSDAMKDSLGEFFADIDTRAQNISDSLSALSPSNEPMARAALRRHKQTIKREVKSMLMDGEPAENIFAKISTSYIADTEGFWKNWFMRIGNYGVNDFVPEVREATTWDSRYSNLIELLKGGENFDDINLLIEKWQNDDLSGTISPDDLRNAIIE